MHPLVGLGAVLLLVGINGFFVAAEFSLVGVRHTRIAQLAAEGNSAAKVTQTALTHLDSYIAATQLGITLASLGLGWIGEPAIGGIIEGLLHSLHFELDESVLVSVSFAISFAIVTLLHIVFGELAPKSIALQRPESTVLVVARPTSWFLALFRPVIWLMNTIGNGVVRLLGFEPAGGHSQVHNAQELLMLVESSGEAGMISTSEKQLLQRVFSFGDLQVRDIMRPRNDVEAIPVNMPIPELLAHVSKHHYTRYPIYEGSIDVVIGMLNTRDLLDLITQKPEIAREQADSFQLTSILRIPLFVPESVSVDDLLQRMKKTKTHFAVVIDEYGGMAGIASLEDVIEEIVGDVQDEYDTDVDSFQVNPEDHDVVVDGLINLAEIEERFGKPGSPTLSTTIGGYVAEKLDRIPVKGDVVRYGDYDVRVVEMVGMRPSRLQFVRDEEPDATEAH